tara:strand:+ start:17298 stop:17576 length:279 start_codon:yes stop_codon:yes gene_type:complete
MPSYNPPIAHYAHVNVSSYDPNVLFSAIGRDGWIFKKLTNKLGLTYLWWDMDNQRVELWGPFESFQKGATKHIADHVLWHSQPDWLGPFHDQ